MEEQSEFITRIFNCKICGTTHEVTLNKKLAEGRNRYPFHHIYLHGDLKDILTILYIDKELQIRGADTELLSREDIFSKEHMNEIIGKLVNEIETLRQDYNILFDRYQALTQGKEESPFMGFLKDLGEGISDFFKNLFGSKDESSEEHSEE
jgi:hypothetical protein